jgi:glycerol-3-phosphate acyltransferase PlsX
MRAFKNRVDPGRYNGANLIGLRGIVIKSHGSAKAESFANAIRTAKTEVDHDVVEKISGRVEEIFAERNTG